MMYDQYIMKRTQIYLSEEQDRQLGERARTEGRTRSAIIRAAIDDYLARNKSDEMRHAQFVEALRATAGIAAYLPDGKTYVEAMRANDLRRQQELERDWQSAEPEAS